jgi:POT family proton-dependent oligopeptide transporter
MYVVLILTFFSMLFWSFFEQAGSSLNNFTDRNVDRVFEERTLAPSDVGTVIRFRIPPDPSQGDAELRPLPLLSQAQLGRVNGNGAARRQIEDAIRREEARKAAEQQKTLDSRQVDALVGAVIGEERFTITGLTYLRKAAAHADALAAAKVLEWSVVPSNVGMGLGGAEIPASVFQSVNPIYIMIFGLAFSVLWSGLAARGCEPSTPVKFSLGLLQLGLGFAAFWWGAKSANDVGIVALGWLLLGYLLHTTGELCLSPVGLSMITRLSPAQLVSTVMGGWFLATAFSQFLAAIIAQFTGVSGGGDGGLAALPVPLETVTIYGRVFFAIAASAVASGLLCLAISPVLKYWMHASEA